MDPECRQKWQPGFRTKRDAERALTEPLNRLGAGGYVEPGRQTLGPFSSGVARRYREDRAAR